MAEDTEIYFIPIEEPRMDCVCEAVQRGIKFLDDFCKESEDVNDVILYVWSKQAVPYYFKQSFTQDAIKILTEGKTLLGTNSKMKLESYETFNPSSDTKVIFSAYPNKKMLDAISEVIDRDAVKAVILVNDEKQSEPWLKNWISNLEKI